MLWLSTVADIGYVLPLLLVALLVLATSGAGRLALCWSSGIGLTILIVVGLKHLLRQDPVLPHFPSGHVALAVAFYGGLLVMLTYGRWFSAAGGVAVIGLLEGISRVATTQHSWLDVGGGLAIAAAALVLTGCPWAWGKVSTPLRLRLVLALAAAILPDSVVGARLDAVLRPWVGV